MNVIQPTQIPWGTLRVFDREFQYRKVLPEERVVAFLAKIQFDDCWLWTAAHSVQGYGVAWLGNRQTPAHRAAYHIFVGAIPEGKQVHHVCSNPACVRPDHLQAVSAVEHWNLTPNSITSIQRDQTHCKRGHALSGSNVYFYPGTSKRRCRECHAEWSRSRRPRRSRVLPTRCPNGHEYTTDNIYWFRKRRCCRACHRVNSLKYEEKRQQARLANPNRRKHPSKWTHCKYGHEFTPENTLMLTHGDRTSRRCKVCYDQYVKKQNARPVQLSLFLG